MYIYICFVIEIVPNPNNIVYETISYPQNTDHFSRKPSVIPTFAISIREVLGE